MPPKKKMPHAMVVSTAVLLLVAGGGLLAGGAAGKSAAAHEQSAEQNETGAKVFVTETWRIRRGGRIYGNWADELDREAPKTTHPSYPKAGKKAGAETWRCKECHGWDYKGKDGAYGSGGHFTGIEGIDHMVGASVGIIEKILRDDDHRYTKEMIPDKEIENLAYFISWGQIDMNDFIAPKTKKAAGNPRHGAEIFQTVCAVCHGLDGRLINFGDEKSPEFVGTVGRENPWEMLHNIRFGHSGDAMIGLIAFPVRDQVDVLSYTQTLPDK